MRNAIRGFASHPGVHDHPGHDDEAFAMQVTAAVAREHDAPFTIEQLELDALRPNEVGVRMVATGICHTDVLVRDGVYPTPLPAVPWA